MKPLRRWGTCCRTTLAVALAAASLSACMTVGPDYQRPEVVMPSEWRSAVVDSAEVTNTAWWEAFGDSELNELIRQALESNRDLRVALYRIEEFGARLQISQSADKPQVDYGFTGARIRRSQEQPNQFLLSTEPEFNSFALGLTASWEIDLWGRVRRSNEAARADLMGTEANQRAVMLSTVTAVATAYVQLLGLDRELAIAQETLKNRRELLMLLEGRRSGGSATQIQVENARADVDLAAAGLPDIERRIAAAENALSGLVGRGPGPIQRRGLDTLASPKVPAGLPSDLLARRPDVLAAEEALIAANARIGVAKAQYFPTISITGALGLASDQLRWLLSDTARYGDFTRGLAGPLFSAGRIEGDVRANEALRKQMAETYLKSVQTGLQEVDDSLVYRSKASEQVDAHGRRVKTLQEVVRLSRLRYDGGQITLLDVLDAERRVIEAQGLESLSRRDQFIALISIYKAMGGGWMVEQNRLRDVRMAAAAPPAQPEIETEAP
jgi:multidrug efflux system outer membrane protein